MRRRFLIPLVLVGATVVPGWAASAAMAGTDTAACLYQGTANTSGDTKTGGGVALQGPDTGNYTFTSFTFDCAGTDGTAETDAAQLNLSSNGTYSNTVCGTGSATGTATVNSVTSETGNANTVLESTGLVTSYTINFTGGEGTLTVTGGTPPAGSDNAGGTVSGSGSTSIIATGPADVNTGQCTVGFATEGAVTLSSADTSGT